jgi:aspartyl-tRNA(Asn)/glutamyl-tRNA(Gln) amidotransferase subunit A
MVRNRSVDPADMGLLEVSALLRARELSSVELLSACTAAIDRCNGGDPSFDGTPAAVNAWARLYPELALAQARAADERLAREREAAPLVCGIPIGLKDLLGVGGYPVTASSRVLADNVAVRDSIAWATLADQGMVLVGHTHTHEFAAGTTTDQVGNPLAPQRSAGGSSGGSAAALAAFMVPAALGTDTGGSLRIPAAFCGISSVKPTHGRVPVDGIVPLAPSLDHTGPMARSVADCNALLAALTGAEAETTPLMPPPAPIGQLSTTARTGSSPLAGLRIAVTDRPHGVEVEADVGEALERVRDACENLGAQIVDVPAPSARAGAEQFRTVMFSEVAVGHARYSDRADGYRPSTREFVDYAQRYHSAAAYIAAQNERASATAAWEHWFSEHRLGALLEPTVPITATMRGNGYKSGQALDEPDPVSVFTRTWNLTGFPVVAFSAGLGARSGLPVGVSLIAPRGREGSVSQIAIDLQERALPTTRPGER